MSTTFWKKQTCILWVVLSVSGAMASNRGKNPSDSRDAREAKMAQQAVFASIALDASPKGRYRCTQDALACVGPDKAELGVALLGARRSLPYLRGLAELSRYQLDAGIAQDYQCYVLRDGIQIRPYLEAVKPEMLAEQCRAELDKLKSGAARKRALEGLRVEDVCRDPSTIERAVKQLVSAINHHKTCSTGDF